MIPFPGTPKGVLLSHHNIVSAMLAYTTLDTDYSNDVYMAFLPLAHVLEFIAGSFIIFCLRQLLVDLRPIDSSLFQRACACCMACPLAIHLL